MFSRQKRLQIQAFAQHLRETLAFVFWCLTLILLHRYPWHKWLSHCFLSLPLLFILSLLRDFKAKLLPARTSVNKCLFRCCVLIDTRWEASAKPPRGSSWFSAVGTGQWYTSVTLQRYVRVVLISWYFLCKDGCLQSNLHRMDWKQPVGRVWFFSSWLNQQLLHKYWN